MSPAEEIIASIRHNKLFSDLSKQELELLATLMQKQSFERGAMIIREGELGECLYLIEHGSVEVVKEENESEHRIAKLEAGECFGEMALFDDRKRSASVRALEKTAVLALPLDELNRLAKESVAYSSISLTLAKHITNRLRNTNAIAAKSLSEELRMSRIHDQMGRFLIHLFILLTFYFYIFKVFEQYSSDSDLTRLIGSFLIIGFGLSAVILVLQSGFSLQFYGLTLKNWKRDAYQGALYTLPFLVAMLIFKWYLIHYVEVFEGMPLFQMSPQHHLFLFFEDHRQTEIYFVLIGLFMILVPVQEFIVRGCLQSSLHSFFRMSNSSLWAVLTSNLLFGMFHGLKSFTFALAAFGFGCLWGWIYSRQRSIIGPTVSHWLVGAWGLAFLDYQSILIY